MLTGRPCHDRTWQRAATCMHMRNDARLVCKLFPYIETTMAGRDAQSVPWFAEDRPQAVLADGARLDGRSFEEFRSVCESSVQRRPIAPCQSCCRCRSCDAPLPAAPLHVSLLALPLASAPACRSLEDGSHQPGLWQCICGVWPHKGSQLADCSCRKACLHVAHACACLLPLDLLVGAALHENVIACSFPFLSQGYGGRVWPAAKRPAAGVQRAWQAGLRRQARHFCNPAARHFWAGAGPQGGGQLSP